MAQHESDWLLTRPTRKEIAAGLVAAVCWLGFFSIGVSIPGNAFRYNALKSALSYAAAATQPDATGAGRFAWDCLRDTAITCVAFTITNIFFLCVSASLLGCMARRWSTPFRKTGDKPADAGPEGNPSPAGSGEATDEQEREVRRAYTSALLRSFLMYFVIIAGYFTVMPEDSLGSVTPGQYIRLAGAVSALAFVVGFEPQTLSRLFQLVPLQERTGEAATEVTSVSKNAVFREINTTQAITGTTVTHTTVPNDAEADEATTKVGV